MNKREIKNLWRIFIDFARQEKAMTVQMILAYTLESVRPFIELWLMGKLLDMAAEGSEFMVLLKYILAVLGVSAVLRVAESDLKHRYNQKNSYIKQREARELNRKSLSMDFEYLEDVKIQELRLKGDERSGIGIVGWLYMNIVYLVQNSVKMLVALGIWMPCLFMDGGKTGGFWCSWQSTLLFLAFIIALIFITSRIGLQNIGQVHEMVYGDMAPENSRKWYYMDMLAGIEKQKDLRIYDQSASVNDDIQKIVGTVREKDRYVEKRVTRRKCMWESLMRASELLVYLLTAYWAYVGLITIGNAVIYASSIMRFTHGAIHLAVNIGYLKQVAIYAEGYVKYLDLSERKYPGTIPVEKRRDNRFSVEFEHVSFRYPGTEEEVLKDLNVTFTIGEKMAIVGKNGSGKTTFIKLLCRLYDVTEGCIKVNGIDIRKYDYEEYCALMAVVFQDFQIFGFSVAENLSAGKDIETERVWDALRRVGMEQRIHELEEKEGAFVGKDFDGQGIAFSGGEKQKLAIARAIYKDAPFVIMDEPTAALDPVAECDVYAGFDEMVGSKTAIYISHRLASCRFCEDILVFDKGRIVQRGSHEELERQDGLYRELWNAQAQYYQS